MKPKRKPRPPVPFKLAYDPLEASTLLPIGEKKVRALVRSGELGSFKCGNTNVIPHTEIQKWLERNVELAAVEHDVAHAHEYVK